MRIGLLIDSLIGGGAERVVLNFAQAFQQQGHDVHIVLVKNEIQHVVPGDIRIHTLSDDGHVTHIRALNKILLAWQLRRLVADVESDGHSFDFFISNAEDVDRLSRIAGLDRVFIRYRNSMREYLNAKIGNKTGLKRLIRSARWHMRFRAVYSDRHIITVSDALQNEIVEDVGVAPRTIRTIYNPFDFDFIRSQGAQFAPPVEGPYIVYAAKLERRKRQDVLLRAYAASRARNTHRLVLIGGAYTATDRAWQQKVDELVDELGLRDRVVMPGFQSNPYPWIKHADLFAMASDSEGLPTVLIESLILGTPVVSTDCPTGPSEILTGELASFLCDRNAPLQLAERIDRALDAYPAITDTMLQRFRADYSINQYLQHCTSVH
ncbi:glycosyltransferase [Uliginosibacterium sp. sgz301328]|uniref:glycosyltransferase n=1 Tax=Uliginosibacterium sp. sgz301328 TaxID=3243764 RepID=UPI00359CC421